MTRIWFAPLIGIGLLGCSSDSPPGSVIAASHTLVDSPLTRMQDVSLIRSGAGFTLAGYDGSLVRWASLSQDGILTQETGFAFPAPVLGPYFAVTQKAIPGDQLVTLALTNSSTTLGGYDLTAIVQDQGAAAASRPITIASLPPGTDPTTINIAAGSAESGKMGYVSWGLSVPGATVHYLTLPANAVVAAAPGKLFDDAVPTAIPAWNCLAAEGDATGLRLSVVTPTSSKPSGANWHTAELNETGSLTLSSDFPLRDPVSDCSIVGSPSPTGYDMAFTSPSLGIEFALYYPDPSKPTSGTVTTYLGLSKATFSDPISQPIPVWTASAGNDITIGLWRAARPQVVRFTYYASQNGSALDLPSANGHTGPVSAWVGPAAVYVTYVDQVSSSGPVPTMQRFFLRIESPITLP